ncbi:TMhelix containing protein [Vibrio phage 1.031.O._10N.261.46.F8]|nr:TMhelix containing protein [Vibrio phage 1.031.O._10N.261.46.F8]
MTDIYMYMYWALPVLCVLFYFAVGRERVDGEIEYTTTQWITMLFGTGMATGLIYWSLPETAYHLQSNPLGASSVVDAAAITWYHWTYNAWMMYTAFAVVVYKFMKTAPPLAQRVTFIVLAISALFGVLVDTGLAIFQLPDGYEYFNAMLLIAAAGASYFSGVKYGILRISQLALALAVLFIAILWYVFPESFVLAFVGTGISYINLVVDGGVSTMYQDTTWTESWTSFYSAWWFLWVAFVGVFIIRISKGRTLRDIIVVATLVPATLTAFWMSSFAALGQYYLGADAIAADPDNSIYLLMDTMFGGASAMSMFMKGVAVILMYAFMLTSIDSGFYASEKMIGAKTFHHRMMMVSGFALSVLVVTYVGNVSLIQEFALGTAVFAVFTVLFMTLYVLVGMLDDWTNKIKDEIR